MSVLIGGPNGRLAFMLNSLSSLNIEISIIIIMIHAARSMRFFSIYYLLRKDHPAVRPCC